MGRLSASSTGSGKGAFFFKVRGGIIMEDQGFFQAILMIGRRHKNLSLLIFFYLFIYFYLFINLFDVGKVRYTIPIYRKK